MTNEWRVCRQCGETFRHSEATAKWFEERGLSQPARCKPCRRKDTAYGHNLKSAQILASRSRRRRRNRGAHVRESA